MHFGITHSIFIRMPLPSLLNLHTRNNHPLCTRTHLALPWSLASPDDLQDRGEVRWKVKNQLWVPFAALSSVTQSACC